MVYNIIYYAQMSTPVKYNVSKCVSCGCQKPSRHRILRNDIKQLFDTYCHDNVAEGIICENCAKQLETIHRKLTAFVNRANSTLSSVSGKRCLSGQSDNSSQSAILSHPLANKIVKSSCRNVVCIPSATANKENELTAARIVSPSKIPIRMHATFDTHGSQCRASSVANRQLHFSSPSKTPAVVHIKVELFMSVFQIPDIVLLCANI